MKFRKKKSKSKNPPASVNASETEGDRGGEKTTDTSETTSPGQLPSGDSEHAYANTAELCTPLPLDDNWMLEQLARTGSGSSASMATSSDGGSAVGGDGSGASGGGDGGQISDVLAAVPSSVEVVNHDDGTLQLGDLFVRM
ncbi:hypothetical protein BaRGS_00011973 [Batillaria attramentaria]|uniref:Uncharacterized protein n=1 Tax=Batillaria attramentaria TaxID=370345 RepID=A0ABD0LCP6_9CAEN